jgi:hypothetical protein
LGPTSAFKLVTPVKLPPGRLRLATSPTSTGSTATPKTMGIVVVAAFAARAEGVPPAAAIPHRARDVPLFVAALPIFSRSYYAARRFDETTLEAPLGSGPYKVGRFEAGRYIEYERVKGWWGTDLPVARGQNNFDIPRYEYYRDREVAFEGFTARSYQFREEFTSRTWATPLREAFIDAFDFEWTNKKIMYGSYQRTHSVFQNSDMMAIGKPSADELALLDPFRGKVSDEVFGEPFVPPVSDGSGAGGNGPARARRWLREWRRRLCRLGKNPEGSASPRHGGRSRPPRSTSADFEALGSAFALRQRIRRSCTARETDASRATQR